jgi:hypothetical protein
MTQIRTQFDLMRVLAQKLAGREVIVRMQTPKTTGSLGTLHINQDGIPVLTIMPYLDGLDTFLHECAHVRLHADKMVRSDLDQAKPRAVTVNKAEKQPSWELQADALRDHWLSYGRQHADPTQPDDEGILWALMDYYR